MHNNTAAFKHADNLPDIALQRSPCMFFNTGISRYVNELQKAMTALGVSPRPFQRFPDMALSRKGLMRKWFALVDAMYDSIAYPRRMDADLRNILVHYTMPPARISNACTVTTCHDLSPLELSQKDDFSLLNRMLFKARLRAITRADFVITLSEYVRHQLLKLYPYLSDRCQAIHLGLTAPATLPRTPSLKDPDMILMVGKMTPNKNFHHAIPAFARFRTKYRKNARLHIVCPYDKDLYLARIKKQCQDLDLKDSVVLMGHLPEETLWKHYAKATYFLFPSLQEGFGIPVLEAQRAGCCCISSNTTSLPEVGGDGCVYVNPLDDTEIFKALETLETSAELRYDIISKGLRNAQKFTWENCARKTIAVYREAWQRYLSEGRTHPRKEIIIKGLQ